MQLGPIYPSPYSKDRGQNREQRQIYYPNIDSTLVGFTRASGMAFQRRTRHDAPPTETIRAHTGPKVGGTGEPQECKPAFHRNAPYPKYFHTVSKHHV